MLAVVKMSDFHECAGAVVGIQGTTLRLAGGFTALCKYLGMTSDLKSLWVDERVLSESTAFSANDAEPLLCTKALSCMFDDEVVDAIDTSDVVAKLERHGYRKSASSVLVQTAVASSVNKSQSKMTSHRKCRTRSLWKPRRTRGIRRLATGSSPCAYLVEHGSLEAFMGRVPKRERPPLPNSPRFRRSEAPIFTANAGDVVGSAPSLDWSTK